MKTLILTSLLTLTTLSVFSQRQYDFDVPLRAKSNEGVYEWYIDHLDDTCDSLVNELFSSIGVNTDSIQWMYPTDLIYVCHKNGWDYYSRKVYFVNDRDKQIECMQKNISKNKLPHSLFDLEYFYKDGVTTLVLVEYY
jgi:hypothetical protein